MKDPFEKAHSREKNDPLEGDRRWNLFLWIFLIFMISWASIYFAVFTGDGKINGGDNRTIEVIRPKQDFVKVAYAYSEKKGKKLFKRKCSACHQKDGNGLKGSFPPLNKSKWVVDTKEIPTKILLKGLQGEIKVNGILYDGNMPDFKKLSSSDLADILTYVRSSWDNKAEAIDEAFVEEIRKKYESRSDPWTAKEL